MAAISISDHEHKPTVVGGSYAWTFYFLHSKSRRVELVEGQGNSSFIAGASGRAAAERKETRENILLLYNTQCARERVYMYQSAVYIEQEWESIASSIGRPSVGFHGSKC